MKLLGAMLILALAIPALWRVRWAYVLFAVLGLSEGLAWLGHHHPYLVRRYERAPARVVGAECSRMRSPYRSTS